MMQKKKIPRFTYGNLTNEAHVAMHEELCVSFEKFNPQIIGINDTFVEYKATYAEEVALLDFIHKSEFTQQIVEQDKERNKAFFALKSTVNAAKFHYDKNLRPVADRVDFVLETYGNIASRTYNEKTAAIDDVVRELRDTRMGEMNQLNLTPWVNALDRENIRFKNLVGTRTIEWAKRPVGRMLNLRSTVDKHFRNMINYLEATYIMTNDSLYLELINEISAICKRYKLLVSK